MNIRIKATQIELTEPLREYIMVRLKGLEKILVSFEKDRELTLEVEVARTTRHHHKGDIYYIELTMRLLKNTLRVEHTNEDVRVAVDEAKKRMKIEMQRYKEKTQKKRT